VSAHSSPFTAHYMKLIVCSTPETLSHEQQLVQELLHCGLETFHLRKPTFSKEEMKNWLEQLEDSDRRCVVLHSHWALADEFQLKGIHIGATAWQQLPLTEQQAWLDYAKRKQLTFSSSVHNQEEINRLPGGLDYVWLSPIYESISKQAYSSTYSQVQFDQWVKELKEKKQTKVYALGGVTAQHAADLAPRGFDGMVVLGSVWSTIKGIEDKEQVKQRINQLIHSCKTDLIS
jgi:thiamine-phosphate pyrophosphorylase